MVSSVVVLPAEVVVPPAAWKAMADDSLNIFLVIVFATIGADLGALVNYGLSRWLGRPIVYKFANSRLGHMCLIDEEKVKNAEEYFCRHGAASTFFGRLVPAVRQLISIPAGLSGMKMAPFLLYTTLGAGQQAQKICNQAAGHFFSPLYISTPITAATMIRMA